MLSRNKLTRFPMVLALGGVLLVSPAMAEDMPESPTTEDSRSTFERERLFETATREDAADLLAAETARDEAQGDLDRAVEEGAEADVIDRLTKERDSAQVALDREVNEGEALADAIDAMSDQQVRNVNRSLHNSTRNRMPVELDAETLQDVADRDLNRREIQSLTKALEEEAKASRQAARFEQKYDDSGREQFLRNRDRALDRGERQRDHFDRKVDRSVERRADVKSDVRSGAREEAKASARENAKQNAKAGAKSNAKNEAKRAAREEIRREARSNGRGRN